MVGRKGEAGDKEKEKVRRKGILGERVKEGNGKGRKREGKGEDRRGKNEDWKEGKGKLSDKTEEKKGKKR